LHSAARLWIAFTIVSALVVPVLGLAGSVASQPVFHLTQVDAERDGTEPSLRFGPDGTVFVAAPCGLDNTDCKSGWLWSSADEGATFQRRDDLAVGHLRGAAVGSGDSEIAVTSDGRLLYADLWGGDVSVSASDDHGATWASTMPVSGPVGADRQWMETDGNDVYVTYQAAQGLFVFPYVAGVYVAKSTDGGLTFPQVSLAALRDDPTNGWHSGIEGNLVVGPDHAVYMLIPQSGSDVNLGAAHSAAYRLALAKSTDGGLTWALTTVADRDDYPAFNFPVLAQDAAGNLYAAWGEARYDGAGNYLGGDILVSHSADGGATWSPVQTVVTSQGSAELPWIAAGGAGKLAIGYYGTDAPYTARDYDGTDGADDAAYYARVAWTQDGLAASPTWTITDVDPTPVAHGDLARQLFDFVTVRVDAAGHLGFVYARSVDGTPDTSYGFYSSSAFATAQSGLDTVQSASPLGPIVGFNSLWFKPAIYAHQTDGPTFG
jgi:hypothetical protein